MPHHAVTEPSPWIVRHAGLVTPGATVLDVAAGGGRHARFFRDRGHPVVAVDRDVAALGDLGPGARVVQADLEDGSPWPLGEERFGAVVVVRYLHRPLMPRLVASLAPGGVLLYETFERGQALRGRPRNPDHLLEPGELRALADDHGLRVVAWEHADEPAVVQRLAAVRDAGTALAPSSGSAT